MAAVLEVHLLQRPSRVLSNDRRGLLTGPPPPIGRTSALPAPTVRTRRGLSRVAQPVCCDGHATRLAGREWTVGFLSGELSCPQSCAGVFLSDGVGDTSGIPGRKSVSAVQNMSIIGEFVDRDAELFAQFLRVDVGFPFIGVSPGAPTA